jgi:NAD(P)-dependent dehydrogenase (short-subunit alcohol dehydrogenase family)
METLWSNKKVLITGGTSGLGRALALELARRGAHVAIVARGQAGLAHTIEEASPLKITGIQADVSQKEDIYRISAAAIGLLGGVDVLINNASSLGRTPLPLLIDTECEDFASVLETNVLGPFRLTKAIVPTMLLHGRGIVLNISSDAAVNPYSRWGAYGTSKAALAHLSRIWNEELGPHGIQFFAFDPGDMNTPMHAAAIPDADPATLIDPHTAALRLIGLISSETDFQKRGDL